MTESIAKVYGAKAKVQLKYTGTMHELAAVLQKGLLLPDFEIEKAEWPPFDLTASLEVLGWELWLTASVVGKLIYYTLEMQTSSSEVADLHEHRHDLSPWLAKHISSVCDIEAVVV